MRLTRKVLVALATIMASFAGLTGDAGAQASGPELNAKQRADIWQFSVSAGGTPSLGTEPGTQSAAVDEIFCSIYQGAYSRGVAVLTTYFFGGVDCNSVVYMNGQASLSTSEGRLEAVGNKILKSDTSGYSEGSFYPVVIGSRHYSEFSITLTLPAGYTWTTAPGECVGVGTPTISCFFARPYTALPV